jgi:hypothetical protein
MVIKIKSLRLCASIINLQLRPILVNSEFNTFSRNGSGNATVLQGSVLHLSQDNACHLLLVSLYSTTLVHMQLRLTVFTLFLVTLQFYRNV